uniref:toll-like receptor 1 n=1 Tax=Pristiophorus japonicus TaxID=55135 RepID=UPI00398F458B
MANILSFFVWILILKTCYSLWFPEENGIVINNSSCSLSAVPKYLPSHTQILDLSQNNITEIHIQDFASLHWLKSLNLSSNKISNLSSDFFRSNQELECLDLSKNELSSIECHFLHNVTSLKYLDISYNNFLSLTLGKAFSFLKDLEYLGLGSRKAIKLQKNDLKEISGKQLQEISIGLKTLSEYDPGSLQVLRTTKLHIVLPSTNKADLLERVMDDAFNTSDTLKLSNIECYQECSHYINSFKILGKFSRVSKLLLQNLALDWKDLISISKPIWTSTVKSLSFFNVTLYKMINSPFQCSETTLKALTIRQLKITLFYFSSTIIYNFFATLMIENLTISNSELLFMTCPIKGNNYKFMDFSDNSLSSDFLFQDCQSLNLLETLILQQNKLDRLFKVSTMTRSMKSLKNLDVSQNQLTLDENRDCLWTNSLIKLNLSSNRLTDLVFTCLPSSLAILDLQKNDIYSVPKELNNLDMLKELYLGANKLVNLPDCSNFRNLQILFVEANSFHEPSSSFLQSCQRLTVLNAASNPFICTCHLRDFSRMKENSHIEMIGWPESYQCAYPDNLKGTLLKHFHLSEVTCSTTLILVIVLGNMIVLIIVIGLMCHFLDLPWYLRMTWQWAQMKRRAMKTDSHQVAEKLVYHAFVSYSQHDSCWVKEQLLPNLEERGSPLRICLHERHFIPGKGIIENIINCIEKSYKSIFVLSPNFIQSDWCHYELYFAQHQVLSDRSDNLMLIVLESIPQYLIPSKYYKLKSLMAKKTYIEWPKDKNKQRLFWANLQAAIGIKLTAPTEETFV